MATSLFLGQRCFFIAVSHLDGTTQQNAALVEQAATASGMLHEQVERLTQAAAQSRLGR